MPIARAAALCLAVLLGLVRCAPKPTDLIYPSGDLRPPDLVAAGPASSRDFVLNFDEPVSPVAGSFAAAPASSLEAKAEGRSLLVLFASGQAPGADYSLVGEVEDLRGNRTRFLVRFTGWNDRAPRMRLSEVVPCKNSSKTKPHRDYVELEALEDGNLGGVELSWASSVKTESYRFPGAEVRKGDFVVLHLAPEGKPEERDESGADLAYSGGVDAAPGARDFWFGAMALPDASGAVAIARRPGAPPEDGLFYADDEKSGELGKGELAELVSALAAAGAWPLAGASPTWSDGVAWGGSSSRSLCRAPGGSSAPAGKASWYVSDSGAQSPGLPNGAPAASSPQVSAGAKAAASLGNEAPAKAKKKGRPTKSAKKNAAPSEGETAIEPRP